MWYHNYYKFKKYFQQKEIEIQMLNVCGDEYAE